MFLMMASTIRDSIEKARGGQDPAEAAQHLDDTLENVTDFDGALLLRMAPETMAAMMKLSTPDPRLMEYVSRTLLLSSKYSAQAGDEERAALRRDQAAAVADAFGIELYEGSIEPVELDALFDETLPLEERSKFQSC